MARYGETFPLPLGGVRAGCLRGTASHPDRTPDALRLAGTRAGGEGAVHLPARGGGGCAPTARIAVIGGGWAGLAAAVALHDAGCRVSVFEASRVPGGRARRVARENQNTTEHSPPALPLDNGQHLLLGAYHATLALMRRLGRDPDTLFLRTPLRLQSADGRLRLAAPRLPDWLAASFPALLTSGCALLAARGLSVSDRLAALRLVRSLHAAGWSAPPDWTATRLLDHHRQPERLQTRLWQPLCLAALNTPAHDASAVLFAAVLRDTLARRAADADLLLARTDLSALWPDAAVKLVDWRPGQRVRTLAVNTNAAVNDTTTLPRYHVDGEPFDAVVLAVPPDAAAALLASLPALQPAHAEQAALLTTLRAFRYLPIATLTLTLAAPWRLPAAMLMLDADPAHGHYGQWLFDRAALIGRSDTCHNNHNIPDQPGELAVVISATDSLPERGQTRRLVEAQIRNQIRSHPRHTLPTMPPVADWHLITEKRATFAATPSLARPAALTPWPGLALAGDWTDTGYPGVLEGAVRSGQAAAQVVLDALQ